MRVCGAPCAVATSCARKAADGRGLCERAAAVAAAAAGCATGTRLRPVADGESSVTLTGMCTPCVADRDSPSASEVNVARDVPFRGRLVNCARLAASSGQFPNNLRFSGTLAATPPPACHAPPRHSEPSGDTVSNQNRTDAADHGDDEGGAPGHRARPAPRPARSIPTRSSPPPAPFPTRGASRPTSSPGAPMPARSWRCPTPR